jgi:hypothetical protein
MTLDVWSSKRISLDDWTALSTLTNLKFLDLDIQRLLDPLEVRLIPRSVEHLLLHQKNSHSELDQDFFIELLRALPPNLRTVDALFKPIEITPTVARQLHNALEQIKDFVEPAAVSFLPPSITYFGLSDEDPLNPTTLVFPPKLHHLRVHDLPSELIKVLPNNLQSLKCHAAWTDDGRILLDDIRMLPRTLTNLELPQFYVHRNELRSDNVERFFDVLPHTLTHLAFGSMDHECPIENASSSLHLPRGLKILVIHGPQQFLRCDFSEWIIGLPKNLTKLRMNTDPPSKSVFSAFGTLQYLKELDLDVPNPPITWAERLDLKSLPRTLTAFSLNDDPYGERLNEENGSDITNDLLRGIPSSLTHLTLPRSPLLTQECLHYLPNLVSVMSTCSGVRPSWSPL